MHEKVRDIGFWTIQDQETDHSGIPLMGNQAVANIQGLAQADDFVGSGAAPREVCQACLEQRLHAGIVRR